MNKSFVGIILSVGIILLIILIVIVLSNHKASDCKKCSNCTSRNDCIKLGCNWNGNTCSESPSPTPPSPTPTPPSPTPSPKCETCNMCTTQSDCTALINCNWDGKKCTEKPKPTDETSCTAQGFWWNQGKCNDLPVPIVNDGKLPYVSLGTLQSSVPDLEAMKSPWNPPPSVKKVPSKTSKISPRNGDNEPVDWFLAYKLPDTQGALYLDSKMVENGETTFSYEEYKENNNNTYWGKAMINTYSQIPNNYEDKDVGYAIWNDAPGGSYNGKPTSDQIFSRGSDQFAHEKGAFCYDSNGGWLMQQTQDHYPYAGMYMQDTSSDAPNDVTAYSFNSYFMTQAPYYNPYAENYFCCSFQNDVNLPKESQFYTWGGVLGQVAGLELYAGGAKMSSNTPKGSPLYNWFSSLTWLSTKNGVPIPDSKGDPTSSTSFVWQSASTAWLYRGPVSTVLWPYTQSGEQIMVCPKSSYWFRSQWYDLFMPAVSCLEGEPVDYQLQDWWRTFQSPVYCKGEIPPDNWRCNWFPFKRGQPLPMSMSHALDFGSNKQYWSTFVDHSKWMVPSKEFRDKNIAWCGFSGLNHTGSPCPGSFSDSGGNIDGEPNFCPQDWYYTRGCGNLRDGQFCTDGNGSLRDASECHDQSGKTGQAGNGLPNYKTGEDVPSDVPHQGAFEWSLSNKIPTKPTQPSYSKTGYYSDVGTIYTAGCYDGEDRSMVSALACTKSNKIYPGNYGANCSQWFRGGYVIAINSPVLADALGSLILNECGCDDSKNPKTFQGWEDPNTGEPLSKWKWDYSTMNNSPEDVLKIYQERTCAGKDCNSALLPGCVWSINSDKSNIQMQCMPFIPTEVGGVGTLEAKYRTMGPKNNIPSDVGNWSYNVPPCFSSIPNNVAQLINTDKKLSYSDDTCPNIWKSNGISSSNPNRDPFGVITHWCPST